MSEKEKSQLVSEVNILRELRWGYIDSHDGDGYDNGDSHDGDDYDNGDSLNG